MCVPSTLLPLSHAAAVTMSYTPQTFTASTQGGPADFTKTPAGTVIKERNKAAIIYGTVAAEGALASAILMPDYTRLMLFYGVPLMMGLGYLGIGAQTLDHWVIWVPGSRALAGAYSWTLPSASGA